VVDAFAHMGKKIAHLDAALPIFLEPKWRGERRASLALGRQIFHREQFAGILVERRFGIERIDMRWAAIGENVNYSLGLGGEVRSFGRKRRSKTGVGLGGIQKSQVTEQAR